MGKAKKGKMLCLVTVLASVFMLASCGKTGAATEQATETTDCGYEVTLPDGYEEDEPEHNRHYPTIYVMPQDGHHADDSGITEKLQQAMANGISTEMIIVRPSFEEGADLHAQMKAIIADVDENYRTIADAQYRALVGTGTGGYLAYAIGLENENLFTGIASIHGDFVSDENKWYASYGDVYKTIQKLQKKDDTFFESVYTYMDAPVDDAWTDMEGSTNDMGALFIEFGTSSAAHEFTVRAGTFDEEFLTESVNRVANRITERMFSGMLTGSVVPGNSTLDAHDTKVDIDYTVNVSDAIDRFIIGKCGMEVKVTIIDTNTGEVLREDVGTQEINGAGEYTGNMTIGNVNGGTSMEIKLSVHLFNSDMEVTSTRIARNQGVVIEGAKQSIDLTGDWYFNYVGKSEILDVARLSQAEYEAWSVAQPGLGHWTKGYGNISDKNVKSLMGEDYFDYMIVGSGYYVKEFEVPTEFGSQDLILSIGYVDDRCEVFLNGTRVGATGMDEKGNPTGDTTWAVYSNFELAPELLKRGETNMLVVRAWNDTPYGAGGWYGGPIGVYSRVAFEEMNGGGGSTADMRFYEETFASSYAAKATGQKGEIENPYFIYLPEGYAESERYYPTVYLLHQFNSDHTSYQLDKVNQILDEAIAAGMFDEMIVVIPNSAEESWWKDEWENMIIEELIPHIDANYRTIKDARYRLTAGCSMGGQGAFGIALRNPDYFTGAISFFGAFSMGGDNSPNKIATQESNEYLDYYTMYFICGNQDSYGFGAPAIELHQMLAEKGIEHGFFIENGGHDGGFYLPKFADAFAYTRGQMYQYDAAVEEMLSGTVEVDTENGVTVTAHFEGKSGIEEYFHTVPDSTYTKNANPELSIPLIVEVVQDGEVVYRHVENDFAINQEQKNGSFTYDVTQFVDTSKEYTVIWKAAMFDHVIELETRNKI